MTESLVRVRLLGQCTVRGGALYNPGDCAAFAPEVAGDLLHRGIAELLDEEESPMPATPATKAPDRPPKDKMIHRLQPWTKGGQRT